MFMYSEPAIGADGSVALDSKSWHRNRPSWRIFKPERFTVSCLNSGVALRLWELRMPRTGWTPSVVPMVPSGADQTVYLVVDSFGRLGTAYRETDIERTDLETVITDLMSGQFNDPVRVVAFNTLEHWAQDVSRDVALEIQSRCDIDGHDVPETLRDFVDSHAGPDRQLALRLAKP
jgi:hypothetical protein